MKRARGLAFAGGIAVASAVAWAVLARPPAAVVAPVAAVPQRFAHDFVAGRELSYSVKYRSDGTLSVGSSDAGTLASGLEGRLVRTVIGTTAEGRPLLLYRFVGARVVIAVNDASAEAEGREVETSLAAGLVVEHAPAGQVMLVHFPPSASALARSFGRALVSWLQTTLPRELARTWSAHEVDTNGAYVAGYARIGEGGSFRKTKRTGAMTEDQAGFPTAVRGATRYRSVTEIDFDRELGAAKEVAGEEWVEAVFGAFTLGTTRSTFEAELTNQRTLDAPALAALLAETTAIRDGEATPLDAHDPRIQLAAKREASERWLGKATLPEILRSLHAEPGTPSSDRHFNSFLQLSAYAFLHPESCMRIAELLAPLAPNGGEASVILEALSSTGTPEAQAALVSALFGATTKVSTKLRIVATLGMLAHPTEASEAALRKVRVEASDADLSATAALGLGIMAKTLASGAPKRAAAIVDEAIARTTGENDERQLIIDLSALGNTGSSRVAATVLRSTRSAVPAVRAQAAFALRLVASDDAETALLAMLEAEDDLTVRARVARALSYREPSARSLAVQSARARADGDASLRAALLENIYAMRVDLPDAIAFVSARAADDPDANVRKVAAGLVATGL